MTDYEDFVFYDKLVSPVNGHTCRIITSKNIKKFGFSSTEQLKKEYPGFPLVCKDISIKRSQKAKDENLKGIHLNARRASFEKKNKKKRNEYIPKICSRCGKYISFEKRNNAFCSKSCANVREHTDETKLKISNKISSYHKSSGKKISYCISIACSICGKIQNRKIKNKSNTGLYTCGSKICHKKLKAILLKRVAHKGSRKGGKASASKQVRRSKQEIELYDLLSQHFQNIDNNKQIANGWDADILLYDYKIAILWNGPWHYREMGFGNHSLKQVVNRDCIKIEEFEKIGWKVLIYQDNKWTPLEAMIDVLLEAGGRIELP